MLSRDKIEMARAVFEELGIEAPRPTSDGMPWGEDPPPVDRIPEGADGVRDDLPPARGEATGAGNRIRLIRFRDIVLTTTRRDLIKGIIPRVGLTVGWGPPKCGKSFWVFDAMMHVANGWPYRGRRVHQGAVVYCAFEGQTGLEARVEAFRRRNKDMPEDPPFFLEPVTLDLVRDHPALISAIRAQLGAETPAAVVLDTLNRSLLGSESKDEDMAAYVRAADLIREAFACAVVVIHHCGIAGDRPRGHTALTGAADAQLAVKRDATDRIVVEVELAKDGPQGEQICSRLEVVEVGRNEDGDPITSCVIVPDETETQARGPTKLSPTAAKYKDALLNVIAGDAATVMPGGRRAASVDLWRAECERMGLIEDSKDAKGRAHFSKYRTQLIAANAVACEGALSWPIG